MASWARSGSTLKLGGSCFEMGAPSWSQVGPKLEPSGPGLGRSCVRHHGAQHHRQQSELGRSWCLAGRS